MREFLTLLIESDNFLDNAAPAWLTNPFTGERMELDRYYEAGVGFEFQGSQHFRATDFCNSYESAKQQGRDMLKQAIFARLGKTLIEVLPCDLNLEAMRRKVGTLLPGRDLRGHESLIDFLNRAGRSYARAAAQ